VRIGRPQFSAVFVSSDEASLSAQHFFLRLRLAELCLLVAAALIAAIPFPTLALTSKGVESGPLVGGLMFFLAGLLETSILTAQPERTWYEARALAESTKTLAWRYAVAGMPLGKDVPDADRALLQRLQQVVAQFPRLAILPSVDANDEITTWMRDVRQSQLDQRREIYLRFRIEDQRRWYAAKSQWNRRRTTLWSVITLLVQFGGVVAGVVKAFLLEPIDFLPVVAAIAAVALAWLQIKQHATLAESYSVAAIELSAVILAAPPSGDESAWARFVDESENAVSREHTTWRAKRSM
jgi:SMODS and SLOG-associating 2TM effector domain 3/SMODS and SLOG-associating 2TM effector domain 1